MKRVLALGVLAIGVTAGLLMSTQAASEGGAAKVERAPEIIRHETRNGVRTLQYDALVNDGFSRSQFLTEETEIDLTAVTLITSTNTPGLVFHGLAWVEHKGTILRPVQIASSGHGTIHLTFDPPIPLRTGDSLNLQGNMTSPSGVYYQMVLSGYDPATRSQTGFVVR